MGLRRDRGSGWRVTIWNWALCTASVSERTFNVRVRSFTLAVQSDADLDDCG